MPTQRTTVVKNILIMLGFTVLMTMSLTGLVLFYQGVDELGCCGHSHTVAWVKIVAGVFMFTLGLITVLATSLGAFNEEEN